MTSEIGADSARSHDGKVVPKTTPCSFAAGKLVQGTAALLSVGLMLNWRTALLASFSLTGRFSPVWEAGEGGEEWCWTLAIAGEEHCSQEASALPRGQQHPHHPLAPPARFQMLSSEGLHPRGCSHTNNAHPLPPPSFGALGYTTAPSDFIPLLYFFNNRMHSAAHSLPSLAAPILLPNCSL